MDGSKTEKKWEVVKVGYRVSEVVTRPLTLSVASEVMERANAGATNRVYMVRRVT